jgi:hypothetical protein
LTGLRLTGLTAVLTLPRLPGLATLLTGLTWSGLTTALLVFLFHIVCHDTPPNKARDASRFENLFTSEA